MGIVVVSVEDDEAAFYVLQLAFAECGLPVELYRARDGEEALAMLRPSCQSTPLPRPDLILLDLNLPQKSGLEVLAALRAHPQWSSIPVVIFTSSSREAERAQCLALGAADYITKPSDYPGVVQAVQSACARAAAA